MKKTIVLAIAALTLAACSEKKPMFTVKGSVEGAQDSTLCLYNNTLGGAVLLDSVKLGKDGTFCFEAEAPQAPDLYCLNIANQIIYFGIDSTETITINAHYPNMAQRYEVEGSENCQKIRELALKQQQLQQQAIALERNLNLSRQQIADSIDRLVYAYKQEVVLNYIYENPGSIYAYFALFQTLGNWLIFNPRTDKEDIKAFAAVATSWDTYYPHAERGQNLHNIAIEGMKNQRIMAAKNQEFQIEASKVQESGVLDIALIDNKGSERHLTDLKGQVVLLDFHIFALEDSPARIIMLRELYNKYHAQGLEIYQVSLDSDEHFWKQQTAALPWISVRDADGVNSQRLVMYNIQAVPDLFIIDRGNDLVKRAAQIKDLEAEIKKLL